MLRRRRNMRTRRISWIERIARKVLEWCLLTSTDLLSILGILRCTGRREMSLPRSRELFKTLCVRSTSTCTVPHAKITMNMMLTPLIKSKSSWATSKSSKWKSEPCAPKKLLRKRRWVSSKNFQRTAQVTLQTWKKIKFWQSTWMRPWQRVRSAPRKERRFRIGSMVWRNRHFVESICVPAAATPIRDHTLVNRRF